MRKNRMRRAFKKIRIQMIADSTGPYEPLSRFDVAFKM
jgi:hypothetical protein